MVGLINFPSHCHIPTGESWKFQTIPFVLNVTNKSCSWYCYWYLIWFQSSSFETSEPSTYHLLKKYLQNKLFFVDSVQGNIFFSASNLQKISNQLKYPFSYRFASWVLGRQIFLIFSNFVYFLCHMSCVTRYVLCVKSHVLHVTNKQ